MSIGCPIGSSEAWQIGLLGRAQEVPAATGCPIAVEELAQVEALPQGGPDQGEEAGEAVAPLAQEGAEAQQQIDQQRGPHLPADGVGVVAEEVGQLEGLLEFLEEDLDAPAAAIQVGDGLGAPSQVVGQKDHLAQFALHLNQRDHAAQFDGIGFASRPGQPDQVVAEQVSIRPRLKFSDHPVLHVLLGAGDPEDLTQGQGSQMGEVHVSLVKDHDLAGLHAGAQFVRPPVVMFSGGIHKGEAREEGLEVEPDVALGGGFAPTVPGPVQRVGHELDGSRVHDVNEALEPERQLRATPRAKAGMELLQMREHRPEQRLGHFRVALAVGVREGVFAGRSRAANRRQRTGVQPQGVAHVIETEAVSELGVDQAHDMAPRTECAAPFLHGMFAGELRHQMVGNQIAKLPQKRELGRRWLALCLAFHALPCGRVQTRKPILFYPSNLKPVGQL